MNTPVPELVVRQLVKKSEARELALDTLRDAEPASRRLIALLSAIVVSWLVGYILLQSQHPLTPVIVAGAALAGLMGVVHLAIQQAQLRRRIEALTLLVLEKEAH